MSSFVNEIHALPKRTAIVYMLVSVIATQAVQLLIAGVVRATQSQLFYSGSAC